MERLLAIGISVGMLTAALLPNTASCTDIAVWRPSDGKWYIINRSGSTQWGQGGDIPVPADYNGDGLSDFAVWSPSGFWFIINSSNSTLRVQQWGRLGDIPV